MNKHLMKGCIGLLFLAAGMHCGPVIAQIAEESSEGSPGSEVDDAETVREGLAAAGEDPLQDWHTEAEDEQPDEDVSRFRANIYGSARLDYTITESSDALGDNASRIGVEAEWAANQDLSLFARAEAGFDLLRGLDQKFKPGSQKSANSNADIFDRLSYAGLATPRFLAVFGKNWSTYYQVSGFTDEFDSTGGSASGTFNAGTDGGATGTGRANLVLQSAISLEQLARKFGSEFLHLNLQVQEGRPIPGVEQAKYGVSFGASSILRLGDRVDVGLAYNYAKVPDKGRGNLLAAGIDGDAHAAVLGMRWIGENWYLATTISRLVNHEATDKMHYFDGWGWEVYARHQISKNFSIVGGWNWLEPDSDQSQTNGFRNRFGVIGARYSWDASVGLRRYAYVEWRLDHGNYEEGGGSLGDSLFLGLRWDV